MSFFGNLLDGVTSAGQWALSHSADIGPVIQTVARAAATFAATDEHIPKHIDTAVKAMSENPGLGNYDKIFEYTNGMLVKAAIDRANQGKTQYLEESKHARAALRETTTTISGNVSGIWKMPIGLDDDGHSSASMYADLSMLLATKNIPTTFVMGNKTTYDIVDIIGASIFMDSDLMTEDDLIKTLKCTITLTDGSNITCSHVYYNVPLGRTGSDDTRHSAIAVTYTTTDQLQARYLADQSAFNFARPRNTAVNQWMITLNIKWSSVTAATEVQPGFADEFGRRGQGMTIVASKLSGVLQLLKVTATAMSTPAHVGATVEASSMAALQKLTGTQAANKSDQPRALINALSFPGLGVLVEITDSSFLVADSSVQSEASLTGYVLV